MAKTGNHGQIIPRDAQLLYHMYWEEGLSLPKIAAYFDVTHKSVERVFRELGIPRRGKGPKSAEVCIDCKVVRPVKLPHKLTKNGTGTRCHECLKKYKRQWLKIALKKRPEEVRAYRKKWMDQWYQFGPMQPKSETQWITKAKHLLRTNRRLLAGMTNPALSKFQSEESAPEPTSPMSCQP